MWTTQNTDCPSGSSGCDLFTDHCYCATDSDCASNHCDPNSGLCWPTHAEFEPEVDAALAHFKPVSDGIIVIATPPYVPWPGAMFHTSFARSGHPGIAVVEAAYDPTQTAGVEHEIVEAMTNPYSYSSGHTAWVGPCGCEVSDRCSPPPPGSLAQDTVDVGVTPDPAEQDTAAGIWDDGRNNGAGECVNAHTTNEDYFYNGGGDLYEQKRYDFHWGNLVDFGHYGPYGIAGRPGVASWGHDRVDAFAIGGLYHHIQHMYWNPPASPGWNDWGALPSPYTAIFSPDAFSWRPGRIDVVVVGESVLLGAAHVFHKYYEDGTQYGWTDLGAPSGITINSRVAAAAWNVNRFDLFFLSNQSPPHVWHGISTDGTTILRWKDLGYPNNVTLLDLDAASEGDQQVEFLALSTAGDLWHQGWIPNLWVGWSNWGQPGGDPLLTVGAVGGGDGYADTVSMGSNGHYQKYQDFNYSSPWLTDANQYLGPDISAW